jgi:type IV secretion system protein VirB11
MIRVASQPVNDGYIARLSRFLGPVIMGAFEDDDVTEIYVNPCDGAIRLDTRSRGRVDTGARLSTPHAEQFLNAVASDHETTLTPENPRLQAELPSGTFRGSRLQGFVAPITQGPAFNIRKPPSVVYTLDDYVAAGSLSPGYRALLRRAVVDHLNILVVGGTNSGKTTFCNALLHEMEVLCSNERFVILEDTVELQCAAEDHLALRTPPGWKLAQLVKSTLRTSPNRIIVGEVRDEAALDLLDAWATGHPGGCATLHASTAAGALLRLDRLAQRANVPSQVHLIAEAVNLIALLQNTSAGRRVSDLVRVDGLHPDGRYKLHRLSSEAQQETTL